MRIITYSSMRLFWECPRAYYWRIARELVPVVADDTALRFGSLIHGALERHCRGGADEDVIAWFDAQHVIDAFERAKARALLRSYLAHWGAPPAGIAGVEHVVSGRVLAPTAVRGWAYSGKIDYWTDGDDGPTIGDHKTASQIDGSSLERLWSDAQLSSYALYLGREIGRPVRRVGHDLMRKASIRPLGVTKARKDPETPDEYEQRCMEWYAANPDALHRETVILSDARVDAAEHSLHSAVQAIRWEERNGWSQHWSSCYPAGRRPCAYCRICESNGNPLVVESSYTHKPAHSELRDDTEQAADAAF